MYIQAILQIHVEMVRDCFKICVAQNMRWYTKLRGTLISIRVKPVEVHTARTKELTKSSLLAQPSSYLTRITQHMFT